MILTQTEVFTQQHRALQNARLKQFDNSLVVTATQGTNDVYHVLSRFGDDEWRLPDSLFPSSETNSTKSLRFSTIPQRYRLTLKMACLHYYLHGLEGSEPPRGGTMTNFIKHIRPFLQFLDKLGVATINQVTELICSQYVNICRQEVSRYTGKILGKGTLELRFSAIEILYRLCQHTNDVMPHPWPESTSKFLSGRTNAHRQEPKTKIIPDDVLSHIFSAAVEAINDASEILTIRDKIETLRRQHTTGTSYDIKCRINQYLASIDFSGGNRTFFNRENSLFDACMVIILTTSGVRVHELASLYNGCAFTTLGDNGERFYWMRGRSEKTNEGDTEWMITKITHRAIHLLEELKAPMQRELAQKIRNRLRKNPQCHEAARLRCHANKLLLGKATHVGGVIQTLSNRTILQRINKFAKTCGINWHFTPHQFRRTFAAYAARSVFGDLRYLRDHFKHWSIDMTALYAMNEMQDAELYDEVMVAIRDEKVAVVEHWLEEDTLIAGGMAEQIKTFRSSEKMVKTYETRRDLAEKLSDQVYIRATAVAWCTADDGGCSGGSGFEKTRCSGCDNAVIDDRKLHIWRGIYQQQLELCLVDDIGPSGRERVERDIERCEQVLRDLGMDIDKIKREFGHG